MAPGLHTKLPWPFGEIRRYPAGIVQTMQIGFEEESISTVADDSDDRQTRIPVVPWPTSRLTGSPPESSSPRSVIARPRRSRTSGRLPGSGSSGVRGTTSPILAAAASKSISGKEPPQSAGCRFSLSHMHRSLRDGRGVTPHRSPGSRAEALDSPP